MSSWYGIDASGDELVIATWPASTVQTIANEPTSIADWLERLPEEAAIGIEATGRCHGVLADMATGQGRMVYVLNPRDVKLYAQAVGQRGKTDRQDAQVMARYIAHEQAQLRPYVIPEEAVRTIQMLLGRRAQVSAIRVRLRQSLAQAYGLEECAQNALKALEAIIRRIDSLLRDILTRHAQRRQRWERLCTLPGVGPIVGACLVSLFERISFQTPDALVAFSGLDPRPCESGPRRGRRVLTKRGPAELRRLLYIAAVTFARTPPGKALRERYRQRNLSNTATYVIIARKLLRIAWAMDRHATPFDPAKFQACAST